MMGKGISELRANYVCFVLRQLAQSRLSQGGFDGMKIPVITLGDSFVKLDE